jgi:hypothetical protein
MTFESRIRRHLQSKLDSVPAATGDLGGVLARGRRRPVSYRVAQTAAVAAAIVLAVASTALVVKSLSNDPKLVVSPINGEELPVISEDPLVLQGQPGPGQEQTPVGTEVRLDSIDALVGDDAGEAATLRTANETGDPIVAVGDVSGWRVFAIHSPTLEVLITDASGQFVLSVSSGPGSGLVVGAEDGDFVVARTDPGVEMVTLVIGDETFWQRPVEGIAVIPLAAADEDKHLTLIDSTGEELFEGSPAEDVLPELPIGTADR